MVSQKHFVIIGLDLTVYGLEEYKKRPKGYPVSIVFALHGRLQNQSSMKPLCDSLCSLNDTNDSTRRHLIVVSFDSPNHGARLVNKVANHAWKEGKNSNPYHAIDMWSMMYTTSRTVSDLIDVIENYLFGPLDHHLVETWGVVGFSMGGHASFMAAAEDPRISVAIPIVGTSDFLSLMKDRLHENMLPAKEHLPKTFCDMVAQKTACLGERLKSKHLLIINGQKDQLVKAKFNEPLVHQLRQIHIGKEGHDWKYHVVPNIGHEWCEDMLHLSAQWSDQWLLQRQQGKL
ncbi:hypothetical protein CU097_001904 [Rhizopus azygosporus]|uniref:Peptidase S9 prolyl oligopeptidase catalytic domain-containing protein n=1 Tax=Rhizopus azygosporus TaxID=86630 RepID=A0A367JMX8_RHIAZ|nr:hypothetical protein CU097_001904 [Rhizopus azygosporus]